MTEEELREESQYDCFEIFHRGDEVYFSMNEITVDGIKSSKLLRNSNDVLMDTIYPNRMFSVKMDISTREENSKEEYLDDDLDIVNWSGAYRPESYSLGKIDEQYWLLSGGIAGIFG